MRKVSLCVKLFSDTVKQDLCSAFFKPQVEMSQPTRKGILYPTSVAGVLTILAFFSSSSILEAVPEALLLG